MIAVGSIVGNLTVVELLHDSARGRRWLCRCTCGKTRDLQERILKRSKSLSCGDTECARPCFGHAFQRTPEYRCWLDVRRRCLDSKHKAYKDYGGRGISVCKLWSESYPAFLHDMGRKPTAKHQIDRIDNNKGYEPGNCRWTTREVNQANRRNTVRVEYIGASRTINELASLSGLSYHVIRGRVRDGWAIKRAMTEPVHHKRSKQ